MPLEEELSLSIEAALSNLGQLDDVLSATVDKFASGLADATGNLTITPTADTDTLAQAVEDALVGAAAASTLVPDVDASSITSAVDEAVSAASPTVEVATDVDENAISAGIDAAAASASPVVEAVVDEESITSAVEDAVAAAAPSLPEIDPGGRNEGELGRIGAAAGFLEGKFAGAAEELPLVGAAIGRVTGSLEALGPAGAAVGGVIAATVGIIAEGVHSYESLTAQVRLFRDASGATTEEASRTVVALNELGLSPQRVALGLARMGSQLQSGKSDLEQFGIGIAHSKDGTVDLNGTFRNMLDTLSELPASAERNQVVFDTFGRRIGLGLLPVLDLGKEKLDELFKLADKRHEVFTDSDLRKAQEFSIEVRGLKENFEALTIQVAKPVVPVLTNIFAGVGTVLNDIGGAVSTVGGVVSGGLDLVTGHSKEASHFLGTVLKVAAVSAVSVLNPAAGAALGVGIALEELGKHSHNSAGALKEVEDAVKKVHDTFSLTKKEIGDVKSVQTAYTDSLTETDQVMGQSLVTHGAFSSKALLLADALSTDKNGVTDYGKALSLLDPIAARAAELQIRIATGLEGAHEGFDKAAVTADQFRRALAENLDTLLASESAASSYASAVGSLKATVAEAAAIGAANLSVGNVITAVNDRVVVAQNRKAEADTRVTHTAAEAAQKLLDQAAANDALSRANAQESSVRTGTTEAAQKYADVQQKLKDNVDAAVASAEKQVEADVRGSGGTITAAAARERLILKLDTLKKTYPELTAEIDKHIKRLEEIPESEITNILADTEPAKAELDALNQIIALLTGVAKKFGVDVSPDDATPKLNNLNAYVIHDKLVKVDVAMPTASQLNAQLDQIGPLKPIVIHGQVVDLSSSGQLPPPHMAGGTFKAFEPIMVGEAGPEAVVFGQPGTVIPNNQLGKFNGGGTTTNNITVNEVANDPQATAFAVSARLGMDSQR